MQENLDILIQKSYENFSAVWQKGELPERVQILQNLRNACANDKSDIKETMKNIFEALEPYYVEIIKHSNPKIFQEGIDILQFQLNSEFKLSGNISNLVSTIGMSIMVKKDCKDKGAQILLGIFEQSSQDFTTGIQDMFQFKEPKSITEILRFLNLLIIKDDQSKIKFFGELKNTIFELAANFSTSNVRQTALDLIMKLAEEFGNPFIEDKLNVLKESQRIQLAKRLKDNGFASEEISKLEAKKEECLKQYRQNRDDYKKITQQVLDATKDREDLMKYINELPKKEKDQALLKYNVENLKALPLFVDKIKYARGKIKVHVMRDIHNIFMNNQEQLDENQLVQRWNFEKYFTFDNPLNKKYLIDMLIVYIKKMQETDQLKILLIKTLKVQIQGIMIQLIKSYQVSSLSKQISYLTRFLLEFGQFNHEVMTSLYEGMLNKSDVIQMAAVDIFRNDIVSKEMLSLPKIDCIMKQIALLTSSPSEQLRNQSLKVLVDCAQFIGVDIYNYTQTLNKFQSTKFQQQVKPILGKDKPNADNLQQEEEEKKESNTITTNERMINDLKFQLCLKSIKNEEDFILNLKHEIVKQENVPIEQRLDYLFIFSQLIERFGENIVNNTIYLIGQVGDSFSLKEQLSLFELVFSTQSNTYSQKCLSNLYQFIRFINLKPLIMDLFFVRHQEEKICQFLFALVDQLDSDCLYQIVLALLEGYSDVKDPKAKVVFINFLAKIQMIKGQPYLTEIADKVIKNEKARVSIIQKIDASHKKYLFIEKAKKNIPDEVIIEKESIKNKQNEVDIEYEQIQKDKKEKLAVSFKDFRKQQLQKVKELNDSMPDEPHQQVNKQAKKEHAEHQSDEEI